MFQLAVFLFFSLLMMSGTFTQKASNEIAVTVNYWQFLQGGVSTSGLNGTFSSISWPQWNQRCFDSGIFQIQPRAPSPDRGLSKLVFAADKLLFLISYSGRIIPTLDTSPPFQLLETKTCQFGTISISATRSTSCRQFYKIHFLLRRITNPLGKVGIDLPLSLD